MNKLCGVVLGLAVIGAGAGHDRARKQRPKPAPAPAPAPAASSSLPEQISLPLAVHSAQDITYKVTVEWQYLVVNLLLSAKLAWDSGDFVTAAEKWDTLIRLPNVSKTVLDVVTPLATEARQRAGGGKEEPVAPVPEQKADEAPPDKPTAEPEVRRSAPRSSTVVVSGHVSGGGSLGPGGTVIWLNRGDGTPLPVSPARNKVILQRDKQFIPRVLAVTKGTDVNFRNDDDIYHNVFSLSRPNEFDLGLYRSGVSRYQRFDKPGPVAILCNIHSTMSAFIYVVDSPFYTQAGSSGAFSIRGIPPGDYIMEAWHDASATTYKRKVAVGENGASGISLVIDSDRQALRFVPDKYGNPRQVQLGY